MDTESPQTDTDTQVRARALEPEDGEVGPSSNGTNGRSKDGKFAKGNKLGRGGPFAGRIMRLKAAALKCVQPQQVRDIMGQLYTLGMQGDVAACKAFLDRLFGKEIVAHVEHSGDGQSVVLILPANGTESGARARTSTTEGE